MEDEMENEDPTESQQADESSSHPRARHKQEYTAPFRAQQEDREKLLVIAARSRVPLSKRVMLYSAGTAMESAVNRLDGCRG